MKKFTHINHHFICEVCGHRNPPAPKTCRNHCRKCLCSKHVDIYPGDRAEKCKGILKPIGIEVLHDTMHSILFECERCKKKRKNKIAPDDNREALLKIFEGI